MLTGTVSPDGITISGQRSPSAGAMSSLAGSYSGWLYDSNRRAYAFDVVIAASGAFYTYYSTGTATAEEILKIGADPDRRDAAAAMDCAGRWRHHEQQGEKTPKYEIDDAARDEGA